LQNDNQKYLPYQLKIKLPEMEAFEGFGGCLVGKYNFLATT